MSFVTLTTLVLAMAAVSHSAPTADAPVDLADAMKMSVCPIRVHIDEDEFRIPKRIKMLVCAETPNPICGKEHMTHACCRSHHHNFSTECVTVRDHVLVRYTNRADPSELHKLPVSVGCACMIRGQTDGRED